jgi:hypothetical protein
MKPGALQLAMAAIAFAWTDCRVSADDKSKTAKQSSTGKATIQTIDPWDRPEGSINDQTARYYVWFDKHGWHLRTTSKKGRHFHGKVRVKDARIASCISVGLKERQKNAPDAWRVNAARSEMQFDFRTSRLSDGLDFVVEGEGGEIEFELFIDKETNPKTIFVGRGLKHPNKSPFSLIAVPKKSNESSKVDKKS